MWSRIPTIACDACEAVSESTEKIEEKRLYTCMCGRFSYLVVRNKGNRMTLEERIKQLEERNEELVKRFADKDSRIADLDSAIVSKDSHIADFDRKIVSKDNHIAYLEQQLYGSRSEKRLPINPDALQLSLFSAEIDAQEQQRLDAAIAKDEQRRENLLKVDGYERKVRKPIDISKLEVREEHIYPYGINPDEYNEMEPLVTESIVLVPQKMYIRRIVRHKYVLKTYLQ